MGETSSSRHSGVGCADDVEVVSEEVGMTDLNAWIGNASKNSWANMNGVLDGSVFWRRALIRPGEPEGRRSCGGGGMPLGTQCISSHHVMGMLEYLLLLRNPIPIFSKGLSPHSSFLCVSHSEGLISTRYICSMADASGLKLLRVCNPPNSQSQLSLPKFRYISGSQRGSYHIPSTYHPSGFPVQVPPQ